MNIIVIDQSRVVLKILASMLLVRGHSVYAFTDSREALTFLSETASVEVVISSLEVEPISGLELCWAARAIANERGPLFIILMSARREERNLGEALDSGADDFIMKPPNTEELYARLRSAERMMSMQRELIRLADTDPLTGVLNRRAFSRRVKSEMGSTDSAGLALTMFDIDHFKRINDTYGHDVGDTVIQSIAAEASNERGIVGRLGGEEFAIAYPRTPVADALAAADGLRRRCGELAIVTPAGTVRLTCSFGVSGWVRPESLDAVLKKADLALYDAKTAGRNRVRAAADSMPALAVAG